MKAKTIFIIYLVFSWLNPLKAQYDFDLVEKNRMAKAKVKTRTEWTYDFVNDKPADKGHRSAVFKYDMRGNVTEIVNYNAEGKIVSFVVYQYDNRDNRTNYERYDGNRQTLKYSQKSIFDANGNKIRENGFDGNDQYNNTFKYDANGRLTEISYVTNNSLTEKRQFNYWGNRTEILVYNASNTLTFKQENNYNDKGSLLSEVRTNVQGSVLHSLNMQYNNIGSLLQEIKKLANDKLDYQKMYYYDKDNRPTKEETINLDGSKFVSHEYQYNNLGYLIYKALRRNERATEPSTYKYTYDAKGVCTEMEVYLSNYKFRTLQKYIYEFY